MSVSEKSQKSGQYTPTLEVRRRAILQRTRELPLPGKNLVQVGDIVTPQSIVLSAELPGDLAIVRLAERLGFDPEDIAKSYSPVLGQRVQKGEVICEISSFFGLFSSKLECPVDGTVEFFTEANAHLGIRQAAVPLSVNAYIGGKIVEVREGKSVVVETEGAIIQGIFGVGGERQGWLSCLDCAPQAIVSEADIEAHWQAAQGNLRQAVLVGGAQFTIEAIERAVREGVVGIVTGSIDAKTLAQYVGYEISVSITGDEEVAATLIITEGFGELAISQRVIDLAKSLEGKAVSLNGATQVRAGATRPELIVPSAQEDAEHSEGEGKSLQVGAVVRIIRVPYFGRLGQVVELPPQPERIPTGAFVRVLKARLENGAVVTVPRANVELL